jgi:eukaryotic-like serine/threonine-protein kinase
MRGDLARAAAHLRDATDAYSANHMGTHAAATRRRRGEVLGRDEGRALVEESIAWMASQGIQNAKRTTAMYAPGFPESACLKVKRQESRPS